MSDFLPAKTTPPSPPDLAAQMYGSMDDPPASPSPFRILRFLVFLRKYWWIPVVTLLLSLSAAAAFVLLAPPTYVSTAAIWETEKLRLPEGAAFTEDLQNYYGTQMELLLSGKLYQQTLESLKLTGTNAVPLGKDGNSLRVKVTVRQRPKSSIFLLQASSPVPEYSRTFLDTLIDRYLDYRKDIRKGVSKVTSSSISEQIFRLESDLKSDQDKLSDFQRSNNLAILQEEGNIAGSYLARLQTQLSDLKLDAQLLEATALEQNEAAAGNTNAPGSLLAAVRAAGSGSSSVVSTERQTAFQELELLKIQRDKLSKYLRPKHPKIARLDSDIQRGQDVVRIYQNQNRDQLATSRQALTMKISSVEASITEWQDKVTEASKLIAEAEHLKNNVARAQSLYDRLNLMLQSVDIGGNIDQETFARLEMASPSIRSYRQDIMVLGLALVAGVGLGLGLVFLVEVRDDSFASCAEVNEQFLGSVVGQVPEISTPKSKGALPLIASDDPRHIYAESYRNLRSALLFLPVDGLRPKILLITSAQPNEGKSTIAANLAGTLALGGARVLLVDGDLRRGRLHESLGLRAEPGLSEVLAGSTPFAQAVQPNCLPNLSFLPRGGNIRNPGDAFLSPELDRNLALWREQFDFVIIDTCPVFAADDASSLAPKVDGTLFVVRRRFSRARVVREALDLLGQRQARILGVVFNRADASARSYYYYKHADYYGARGTTDH